MRIFNIPPPPSTKIQFIEGDLLFLAKGTTGGAPPFEHVAIIMDEQSANSAKRIAKVGFYALPESSHGGSGIWKTTAEFYWLNHTNPNIRALISSGRLGDPTSVWNVCWRVDLTPDERRYLRKSVLFDLGKFTYVYKAKAGARIERPAWNIVRTNCVGFVRWVYEHVLRLDLVPDYFPAYNVPYSKTAKRDFASPGHIARAVSLPRSRRPYVPKTSIQARRHALV